jgi:hypothetical protein
MALLKGLTEKRRAKIIEKAGERIESDESVKELAMTQAGASVEQGKRSARLGIPEGRPHAVLATERQIYALPVGGVSKLGDPSVKVPLKDASIAIEDEAVRLEGTNFYILDHAEEDAQRLVEYARGQGASAA